MMEDIWLWIQTNKEWLFSGIAIAVPLAFLGWLVSRKDKTQSQIAGESSTNIQVAGDFNFETAAKNVGSSNGGRVSELANLQFETKQDAEAFEKLQQAAVQAGEAGKIEAGRASFMESAEALRRIVTRYRSNTHLFDERQRGEIDLHLSKAEAPGDAQIQHLIEGIQAIKSSVDQNLAHARAEDT
ncbi:hypothetical protein MHM88_20285 [Epibacterium sp. MM17-32]|jgi:predicted transcriptional regulator|uniref:hypothetical protein n=1 Tax=Epibacterium sp. MM17-32 TaxID=2917734 RepID=UPI001EF73732|nr:hypothetical protein [Epibacterium sp. MM17-32]MCG7630151.1 hypothetical protein [Epibacterium sp. MM17-32]